MFRTVIIHFEISFRCFRDNLKWQLQFILTHFIVSRKIINHYIIFLSPHGFGLHEQKGHFVSQAEDFYLNVTRDIYLESE